MKGIPGFEGRYSITKKGRVWSHPHSQSGRNCVRKYKGKWLKPFRMGEYLGVDLKGAGHYIHRLVGFTYHKKKYFRCAVAHHLDEDKYNNHKSNIMWVTQSQNLKLSGKSMVRDHTKRKRGKNGQFK